MDLYYIGVILLAILFIGFIIVNILIHYNSNPQPTSGVTQSTVTCSYLGSRGDMGNQMFQIACVIAAGRRSNANVILPKRIISLPIGDLFDLSQFKLLDIAPDAVYREYDNYEKIILPGDGRVYDIRGYRQTYKYFEDYADVIRDIFTPRESILSIIRELVPTQYIAVHIRRGDYIKPMHKIPLLREFRQCQLAYYKQAVLELRNIYPDCPVLVCTDSPKLVTPILAEIDSQAILAPISANPKLGDFCTLYLANAVVISNSTYSWWAAYLRDNRPIIAPYPWWDPIGFVSNALNLDKLYLQHPKWTVLDCDTGDTVSISQEITDTTDDTLNIYRLIRGMLL